MAPDDSHRLSLLLNHYPKLLVLILLSLFSVNIAGFALFGPNIRPLVSGVSE